MRDFIRNNPMIVVSVALPVLLIVLFAAATVLPRVFVDPPAHDLVLATDYGASGSMPVRVELDVADGRLRARAFHVDGGFRVEPPRIFEYIAAEDRVREITIELPGGVEDLPDGSEIPIPEFADRRLVTTFESPDGYVFEQSTGGGGLFREIFGRRSSYGARLRKSGAIVPVDLPATGRYYYYNLRFIGWVVP